MLVSQDTCSVRTSVPGLSKKKAHKIGFKRFLNIGLCRNFWRKRPNINQNLGLAMTRAQAIRFLIKTRFAYSDHALLSLDLKFHSSFEMDFQVSQAQGYQQCKHQKCRTKYTEKTEWPIKINNNFIYSYLHRLTTNYKAVQLDMLLGNISERSKISERSSISSGWAYMSLVGGWIWVWYLCI